MSMIDFEGRVIIVTGSGRGMGASHAVELAKRGARVVVNDVGGGIDGSDPSSQPADDVVKQIVADGGEAIANTDSVATPDGCRAIVSAAVDAFGRLDGVLHNAGIGTFRPLVDIDDQMFDEMLKVHLYGGFYLTRAAWPHLAERGGSVVYITSGVGLWGVPTLSHYAAAKLGLIGLAKAGSLDGAASGIRVNALAVAAATRMMDHLPPNMHHWFQTYMKPSLPSAAACWLLHPDSAVTGRVFEAFGAHMAEVFIAESHGFTKLDVTAEDFRDRFDEVTDRSKYFAPASTEDFNNQVFGDIIAAGAEPPLPDETAGLVSAPK